MIHRGEKAKEIKKLKGIALRRRMRELNLTEGEVAAQCGLQSRDAVTQWKAGTSWPYAPGEKALQNVIHAPESFFADIAAGKSYEEALASQGEGKDEAAQALFLPEDQFELRAISERLARFTERLKNSRVLADTVRDEERQPAEREVPATKESTTDGGDRKGREKPQS